jgi:hypothetical protein
VTDHNLKTAIPKDTDTQQLVRLLLLLLLTSTLKVHRLKGRLS